jgi:hypothetical protein
MSNKVVVIKPGPIISKLLWTLDSRKPAPQPVSNPPGWPTTPLLKLVMPPVGEIDWGEVVNENFEIIDTLYIPGISADGYNGLHVDGAIEANEFIVNYGGILTASGPGDVILQCGQNSNAFRGVRAPAWSDNANSIFFQIGTYNDNVAFTSQGGTQPRRIQFSCEAIQFGGSFYNSIPPPASNNLFEIYDSSDTLRFAIDSFGVVHTPGLPVHANNAAAVAAGLTAGAMYRTGGDPDYTCVVH